MSTQAVDTRLRELCQELLSHRKLIIASNRGPIDYRIDEGGGLKGRRGSGGVVTALSAISQFLELTWVASAMGEGDRRAAEQAEGNRFKAPPPSQNLYLRFVVTPGNTYHKFYSVFCNPLLWFLQHLMWNSSHTPNIDARVHDAWETGYKVVNQAIADAVVTEATESELPPLVMLHDYHLYLAARYIRERIGYCCQKLRFARVGQTDEYNLSGAFFSDKVACFTGSKSSLCFFGYLGDFPSQISM